VFGFDVLACPRCGGRLRLIALIEQAAVLDRILRHLGVPTEIPAPSPARATTPRGEFLPGRLRRWPVGVQSLILSNGSPVGTPEVYSEAWHTARPRPHVFDTASARAMIGA